MDRSELIKSLIKNQGMSVNAFAEKIDMPSTTLHSILQRGVGNASLDNVLKICRGLGITCEQLEQYSKSDDIETIAANNGMEKDTDTYTEEELKAIEYFKKLVKEKKHKLD